MIRVIFIFFSINNPIIAGISLLLANLFNAIWITSIWTSLQTFSDEKFVGRVVSIVTIFFGISGFFYMFGGFLGDLVGVYPTMLVACLLIIAINLNKNSEISFFNDSLLDFQEKYGSILENIEKLP